MVTQSISHKRRHFGKVGGPKVSPVQITNQSDDANNDNDIDDESVVVVDDADDDGPGDDDDYDELITNMDIITLMRLLIKMMIPMNEKIRRWFIESPHV